MHYICIYIHIYKCVYIYIMMIMIRKYYPYIFKYFTIIIVTIIIADN